MDEKNYAGYTEEEILKSLKTIRHICDKNRTEKQACSDKCPFLNKYNTGFRQRCEISQPFPYQWHLKECPPRTWTPFEQI